MGRKKETREREKNIEGSQIMLCEESDTLEKKGKKGRKPRKTIIMEEKKERKLEKGKMKKESREMIIKDKRRKKTRTRANVYG